MNQIRSVTRTQPKRVVFPEGENTKVLEACRIVLQEGTGKPILLGNEHRIAERAGHIGLPLADVQIIDPEVSPFSEEFGTELYRIGSRQGYTPQKARHLVHTPARFGMMMLRLDLADAMVVGIEDAYSDTIRMIVPLSVTRPEIRHAAGFHILLIEGKAYVIGDTTLNFEPDERTLADIAWLGAELAKDLGMVPRVAMLSFSNFGDSTHPKARKVRAAAQILRAEHPDLIAEGEMHGDVAVVPSFATEHFPHSLVQGDANVLICPDLDSANIAVKLVGYIGQGREVIGPILEGFEHPVNIVTYSSSAREIANLAAFGCYRACRG
jgi:malate dehydrogenase (oxaloacetate-decarboxylating)(NADP+)